MLFQMPTRLADGLGLWKYPNLIAQIFAPKFWVPRISISVLISATLFLKIKLFTLQNYEKVFIFPNNLAIIIFFNLNLILTNVVYY